MCTNKRRQDTCNKSYAVCVQTEFEFPDFSGLHDETCVSVEESLEDIYDIIGDMRTEADLTDLDGECITYTKISGKITIKNAFLAIQDKICSLEDTIETMQSQITTMQEQIATLETDCN